MSSISKQISAAAQTTLTSPLAVMNALSKTAFGSLEKLIALNISTVKQTLESSSAATRQLLSASKPQELITLGSAQAQPQIEKIIAYGRELASISAYARSEFMHAFEPSVEVISKGVSIKIETPVAVKPAEKIAAKPALKIETASNTQLPLIAETEVKAQKPVEKIAAKVVKPAAAPAKAVVAKPAEKIVAKPAAAAEVKAEVKASATPVVETKPVTKPAAEAVAEKKTAVKMPLPASTKPATKPSFPAVSTRPVYKAKGSAATGAKKPVRQ